MASWPFPARFGCECVVYELNIKSVYLQHIILSFSHQDVTSPDVPELALSVLSPALNSASSFVEALERLALLWIVALSVVLLWRIMLRFSLEEVALPNIGAVIRIPLDGILIMFFAL